MSYEFLVDMAIEKRDENIIDDIVEAKGAYRMLTKAPWTCKAKVLSTGLAFDDEFCSLLKNGREKNEKKGETYIGGYTGLFKKHEKNVLDPAWVELFEPQEELIRRLPLWSVLFSLQVRLLRPFFSRDDLSFYPTENPLKREWVFGVPYLGASGIKGLLRWAWRMTWGDTRKVLEDRVFGPRSEEMRDDNARQGCLWTYPLFWDGKVGLDVINPHDRESGVGKKPIKYEVVLAGALGWVHMLIFNRTGEKSQLADILGSLCPAIDLLLDSGLSAKRSADWGTVEIVKTRAFLKAVTGEIKSVLAGATSIWQPFLDGKGNLKPVEDEGVFTTAVLAELTGNSKSWVKKYKDEARAMLRKKWEESRAEGREDEGGDTSLYRFEDLKADSLFTGIRKALDGDPS